MGPKKPPKGADKPATETKPKTKPKAPKKLSADDKKALFVNYDSANAAYDKAAGALVKASEAKSVAVKAIGNALGTGPFKWKGTQLNIVCRKGGENKADVYYFKSPTRADVQEIG